MRPFTEFEREVDETAVEAGVTALVWVPHRLQRAERLL